MKNNIMIFCTLAQTNKEHFIIRLENWYKQFFKLTNFNQIDFYAFVDGYIDKSKLKKQLKNINLINSVPILTNKNRWAGWFRSIHKAIEIAKNYDYVIHVESDVFIINWKKFQNLIQQKIFGFGFVYPYSYTDTALMFWNNKQELNILNYNFLQFQKLNTKDNIEKFLKRNMNIFNVLIGYRRQRGQNIDILLDKMDYISQVYDDINYQKIIDEKIIGV